MITKFTYKTFVCEQDQLEDQLNELGFEGWRLHTCEPVIAHGPAGSSPMKVFCVLDQAYVEDPQMADIPPGALEGIAMKG